MFLSTIYRHGRALLGAAALLPMLFVGLAITPDDWVICRTDPVVFLSDGTVVQMSTTLATDLAQVQQVTYTLHAPAGTYITRVVYTPGALEVLNFFADQAAHQFVTDTVATTTGKMVAVKATTAIQGAGRSQETVVSGHSAEHLVTTLNH